MSILHSSSEIRKVAYEVSNDIYGLVKPHTSNVMVGILDWFFKRHSVKIIESKSDAELKQIMEPAYRKLKPIFDKFDMGYAIQEGKKLGSPEPPSLGEIKRAMELVKDLV